MKTILITGINGYLGSILAKRYSKKYNIVGLEYDLKDLFRLDGFNFKVYPSCNGISDEIFQTHKIDCIIHTATLYGKNNESCSKVLFSNTYIPLLLFEKALKNGCNLFINTDTILNRFTNYYSLTKNQFNDCLKYFSLNENLKVINLKLEHFYGPGTSNTNFISLMAQKMLNNELVISLTKCEQKRDFLYIDDLIKVYDLMLDRCEIFDSYEEFNVGSSKKIELKKVLELIKIETGSTSKLDYGALPYRVGEIMESISDNSNLKKLGWQSKVSLKEGIAEVVKFERNEKKN